MLGDPSRAVMTAPPCLPVAPVIKKVLVDIANVGVQLGISIRDWFLICLSSLLVLEDMR
jgi:hypothetical protein